MRGKGRHHNALIEWLVATLRQPVTRSIEQREQVLIALSARSSSGSPSLTG